jgi:hypothetical protein
MAETAGLGISVKLLGPVFSNAAVERVMKKTLRDIMQDVVERGEEMVAAQLRSGHGVITGNLKRSIVGEVGMQIGRGGSGVKKINSGYKRSSISDVRRDGSQAVIYDSGVVYGPWIEGVGTRNATTRFKGYAMFRRTGRALDRSAKSRADRHLKRNLRRLN